MPWHLARGYRFAGVHCGIRPDPQRLDLALVVSDGPAAAAGVFTQNRVCAAPVRGLPGTHSHGATCAASSSAPATPTPAPASRAGRRPPHDRRRRRGARLPGRADARLLDRRHRPALADGRRSSRASAQPPRQLAPMSRPRTRRPGHPDDRHAHQGRTRDRCRIGGREIRLTGFAKGAAMIGPNMATMLAFVLTDAPVAAGGPARLLRPRRRADLQLHQRRGPHQHQRHAAAARQRPAGLEAAPATAWPVRAGRDGRLRRAGPGHRRRRRGRHASRHDRRGGPAQRRRGPAGRQDGRRQRPGEDGHLRRRPQLGPHRLRRGLRRRRVRGRRSCRCGWATCCCTTAARRCRSTPPPPRPT